MMVEREVRSGVERGFKGLSKEMAGVKSSEWEGRPVQRLER